MRVGEYTATVDLDRVSIHRGDVLVGHGRWTGRRLLDRPSGLRPEAPEEEETIFLALEAGLIEEAAAELAEMQSSAYDDEGVDLTMIRWMLTLSPRDRLRALDDYRRSMAGLLNDRFHGKL